MRTRNRIKILGDTHNFGKSVRRLDDSWIFKPRPLFLEKLFLSSNEFTKDIEKFFEENLVQSPFAVLPQLQFGANDIYQEGTVEVLKLEPFKGRIEFSDFESVGAVVATCVWFGLGDLHCDNLLVGNLKKEKRFVFTPVDIECAFENLRSPSEAFLVPGLLPKEFSGLWPFLKACQKAKTLNLKNITALVLGYYRAIEIFEKYRKQIESKLISSIDLARARVRVVPRDTKIYRSYFNSDVDLFDCEKEQLKRSEIPYYFKYLNSSQIYYHGEVGEKRALIQNHQKGVSYPEIRLFSKDSIEEQSGSASIAKVGAIEILQLVAQFLEDVGSEKFDDVSVSFDKNQICLKQNDLVLEVQI